jgi:hypothetical protein
MPRYTKSFELEIADIDLIETALRERVNTICEQRRVEIADPQSTDMNRVSEIDTEMQGIKDLLGRLHNQKVFYRPKQGVYVGG